jgi:hypothetical protein
LVKIEGAVWYTIYHHLPVVKGVSSNPSINQPTNRNLGHLWHKPGQTTSNTISLFRQIIGHAIHLSFEFRGHEFFPRSSPSGPSGSPKHKCQAPGSLGTPPLTRPSPWFP